MYSVVLMAALTTAGDSPACWFAKHGGYGGCYGGYNGCYGGCYGGYGGWGVGYNGCYGCYGGYGVGAGAWGGCYGHWYPSYGGHGNYGCYGCYGGCYAPSAYAPTGPAVPIPPAAEPPEKAPPPMKEKEDGMASAARAMLVVDVPEDARLFIDDQPMKTTSASRTFTTPPLERGQTYYYMLRAEVVRNGEVQSETKRILIHAGDEIRASFTGMEVAKTGRSVPIAQR